MKILVTGGTVPHFASKLAIESALHEFDVPFTVIRPNYFFQNDSSLGDPLTKAGIYPMPFGPVGVSAVDVRDIAEAAAIALTSDGHQGKTYNLNGPQVLSGPKVASIWSAVLAKRFVTSAKIWMHLRNRCARMHPRGRRSTFA